MGSPLYSALLEEISRDVGSGGPCARVLDGYAHLPFAAALPLRLLGAVHALVLTGAAPELAGYYPSASTNGRRGADDTVWHTDDNTVRHTDDNMVWHAFRQVVRDRPEEIRDRLATPPQTNEVGRAVPLITGLLAAVDAMPLPIRLVELGSSAGLNLRADHFRWYADGFEWGPPDSPVAIGAAWRGPVPAWLRDAARRHPRPAVIERRGCDPDPLDPLSPDGALALRSYVWPDQPERAARLDGALRLAAQIPAEISTKGAAEFLADLEPEPGTLTIVWHSVMRQYVPAGEWALVTGELERLAAASRPDAGFAHICFEPERGEPGEGFPLTVRIGSAPPVLLARAAPHGVPAFA